MSAAAANTQHDFDSNSGMLDSFRKVTGHLLQKDF